MIRRLVRQLVGFVSGRSLQRERDRNQAKANRLDMILRELLKK